MSIRIPLVVLLCLGTTACASLSQQHKKMDRRVSALESRTAHLGTLENRVDNLSSTSEQVNHLSKVLRDMRGEIQTLQHQVTILRDQQRQQYLDLDRRLRSQGSNKSKRNKNNSKVNPKEKSAYLKAFKFLEHGKYKEATTGFEQFLEKYPDSSYADNAHYWLAETYYVQQNLKEAMSEFQALVKKHPDSSKVPGALLKIGYIYQDEGKQGKARKYLKKVTSKYPHTTAAAQAGKRLGKLQ